MAFNFPTSPTEGTTYVGPNAVTYTYTSGKWIGTSGSGGGGSGLGIGQTWQNVTASRVLGTTYTNNTGKPIFVQITGSSPGGAATAILYVDGVINDYYTSGSLNGSVSSIVPIGSTYRATGSNWYLGSEPQYAWRELR